MSTIGMINGSVYGAKTRLTPEGGVAILHVAGETIAAGNVVCMPQSGGIGGTAGRAYKCPTSGGENEMPVGVAYNAAAAGEDLWVVVSGIASVLPESGITAARGNVLYTSASTAGVVAQSTTGGAVAQHWREVGHWLVDGSGNGAATLAMIHHN